MTIFLIILHVIICIALIGIVLIQRGRGSGLVESFVGIESLFGTKTSPFLTKATAVLCIAFFITCMSLAWLSISQSKSLLSKEVGAPAVTQAKPDQAAPAIPAAKQEEAPIVNIPSEDANTKPKPKAE